MDSVERAIHGKRDVISAALTCLLAEGHLLLEDVPGVGKTSLAKALARSMQLGFIWGRSKASRMVGISLRRCRI